MDELTEDEVRDLLERGGQVAGSAGAPGGEDGVVSRDSDAGEGGRTAMNEFAARLTGGLDLVEERDASAPRRTASGRAHPRVQFDVTQGPKGRARQADSVRAI
ncbi:hypothetical protein [Streptomyces sp. NPDC048106]|uniref:hypothetical protein n=1 Tax=Streptomyces sp. NPDC048106 TaxID=3155750 RepID=UPI003451B44D